jgi:hypothetical protein
MQFIFSFTHRPPFPLNNPTGMALVVSVICNVLCYFPTPEIHPTKTGVFSIRFKISYSSCLQISVIQNILITDQNIFTVTDTIYNIRTEK